ncbi:uncharacterized protein I303_104807 [Kwoniella dejecticola CBS 10117]|uniref:Uncharacterized protein n=1 Tax=Kwoniella dejecticola CBS 10117 TaxID=1296121 RepID=A0A1A6A497_9TREE|nr:uncharacterized protein I303_04212 [Kwoniella dejecticola CBS 10117]OBR84890.1 hypothetical protein I303_04212 [Kwoniella dejecticola CBS 10117]
MTLSRSYTIQPASFASLRMMDFSRISQCADHGLEECWYHKQIECKNGKGPTHFSNPKHFPLVLGGRFSIEHCRKCPRDKLTNCEISGDEIRFYARTTKYDKPPLVRRIRIPGHGNTKLIDGRIDLMGLIIDSDEEINNDEDVISPDPRNSEEKEGNMSAPRKRKRGNRSSSQMPNKLHSRKRRHDYQDPDSTSNIDDAEDDMNAGPSQVSAISLIASQSSRRRIIRSPSTSPQPEARNLRHQASTTKCSKPLSTSTTDTAAHPPFAQTPKSSSASAIDLTRSPAGTLATASEASQALEPRTTSAKYSHSTRDRSDNTRDSSVESVLPFVKPTSPATEDDKIEIDELRRSTKEKDKIIEHKDQLIQKHESTIARLTREKESMMAQIGKLYMEKEELKKQVEKAETGSVGT